MTRKAPLPSAGVVKQALRPLDIVVCAQNKILFKIGENTQTVNFVSLQYLASESLKSLISDHEACFLIDPKKYHFSDTWIKSR